MTTLPSPTHVFGTADLAFNLLLSSEHVCMCSIFYPVLSYAAPYHPYGSSCCEAYVTHTHLPLSGLIEVGAEASGGGAFGSLGMPGSCAHRSGHFPMTTIAGIGGDGGSAVFLEYSDSVAVPYGPLRNHNGSPALDLAALREQEEALRRAMRPSERLPRGSGPALGFRDLVPGPFYDEGVGGGGGSADNSYITTHRHIRTSPRFDRGSPVGSPELTASFGVQESPTLRLSMT